MPSVIFLTSVVLLSSLFTSSRILTANSRLSGKVNVRLIKSRYDFINNVDTLSRCMPRVKWKNYHVIRRNARNIITPCKITNSSFCSCSSSTLLPNKKSSVFRSGTTMRSMRAFSANNLTMSFDTSFNRGSAGGSLIIYLCYLK